MTRQSRHRIARTLPWLLAGWIAWVFVWYLQFKFGGHDGSVWLFTVLTDWLGFHGHEKVMRIGTGAAELAAAMLCFVPALRPVGAAMTVAIMAGAIFFHVVSPLGIDPYGDGGRLFIEACLTLGAGLALLWLDRRRALAMARHLPLVARLLPRAATLTGVALALLFGSPTASFAGPREEIRALYESFAAAQNRRDLAAVKALFLPAPNFLWVSDGMSVWGPDDVIARMGSFQEYEVWRVDPDLDDAVAVEIDPRAAYLHLPLALTLGNRVPGPATHRFLVSVLGVETASGWRIAALFTTARKPR